MNNLRSILTKTTKSLHSFKRTATKLNMNNINPVNDSNDWKLEDYLLETEWKENLKDEFKKDYFIEIEKILKVGYEQNILKPPKELIFNAFNLTKLSKVKAVIIGQDPYHQDNQAHGLAFSVPVGIKMPPSLRNIFKELQEDIPEFERDVTNGGCLQKWATEGVFLLNTFLTVEAHKPLSHSKIGWDKFTDKAIRLVSEKNNNVVFLLWGNFAQKKQVLIDETRHKIIKCGHPSPLSARLFFGSRCFSKTNEYLASVGKTPINWSLIN